MAYKSSYTGPQIDQAVGNALNKDTSTLSNDVNHIPASSVVKSAINFVENDIAIRVVGNKTTYASGAAIGQYVIVSGSTITGITDGLYKAAKAIPYNTVIDNTYLTAATGGGLNDLKAALDNLTNSSITPAFYAEATGDVYAYRIGKLIIVSLSIVFPADIAKWIRVVDGLPRPSSSYASQDINNLGYSEGGLQLHSQGFLQTDAAGLGGTTMSGIFMYQTT